MNQAQLLSRKSVTTAPSHIVWLTPSGKPLATADGMPVALWHFQHKPDPVALSEWARHFRNQYCCDAQIDTLRKFTEMSRKDYLLTIKFPDKSMSFGPMIRAGDFSELLVADYLEYIEGYWTPRFKYDRKDVPYESGKGCDIVGFQINSSSGIITNDPNDIVAIYEAKAGLASKESPKKLQEAVNHSAKDEERLPFTLNAMRQRLLDLRREEDADKIGRFQSPKDRPYQKRYGAAAVICKSKYEESEIGLCVTATHPAQKNLKLLVIVGDDLMNLVHHIYERAANEA